MSMRSREYDDHDSPTDAIFEDEETEMDEHKIALGAC